MRRLNKFEISTYNLVKSCDFSPSHTIVVIMLFYVMFNFVETGVESVFFGAPFRHWLDPVFAFLFMAYSAYAVWWCASSK